MSDEPIRVRLTQVPYTPPPCVLGVIPAGATVISEGPEILGSFLVFVVRYKLEDGTEKAMMWNPFAEKPAALSS